MKDLVIFGTTEFAEIVSYYVTSDGDRNISAFTVDGEYMTSDTFCSAPVVPFEELEKSYPPESSQVLVAIGYSKLNRIRQEKFELVRGLGYEMATFIHSTSMVPSNVSVGENCLIFERNILQPFSSLGDNVIMWSQNVLGHYSKVEDHTFISSMTCTAGRSTIGKRCFLGFDCGIGPEVTIGDDCVIGAHALVLSSAEPRGVYSQKETARSKVDSRRLNMS